MVIPGKAGVAKLKAAAERGDATAAATLGDLCRLGTGVPQGWADAFRWYLAGAVLGNRDAQNNVATC